MRTLLTGSEIVQPIRGVCYIHLWFSVGQEVNKGMANNLLKFARCLPCVISYKWTWMCLICYFYWFVMSIDSNSGACVPTNHNLRVLHGISSFLTIIEQTQVSYCYLVGFCVLCVTLKQCAMSRTNIRILKTNSNFIEIRFVSEASAVRHGPTNLYEYFNWIIIQGWFPNI